MLRSNPLLSSCVALAVLAVIAVVILKPPRPHKKCMETVSFVEDTDSYAEPVSVSTKGPFDDPVTTRPDELMMMGCLPDDYPLQDADVEGAIQAVSIAADTKSVGAVFRFESVAQRDRKVAIWLERSAGRTTFDANPDSDGVIGGWVSRMWRLPNGTAANVMYREKASSGDICVVHANVEALKASLAALNNWCIERLGWARAS